MGKKVYIQPGSGGYGPRVFVPYDCVNEVRDFLNEHCMWGNADKDCGLALSWEFPNQVIMNAHLATLKYFGFIIEPMTLGNAHYVWLDAVKNRRCSNHLSGQVEE